MLKKNNSATKPLWSSRFDKKPSSFLIDFTESISFDKRLAIYDIKGSIAHVMMLKKQKIIPSKDAEIIIKALKSIEKDIHKGIFSFRKDLEDIHMNIEYELNRRIGKDIAGKVHTARSRNDQVSVDTRMWLKDEIKKIINLLEKFILAVTDKAEEYSNLIMPGYTHLQQAQPVLAGHYLMAHVEPLLRDREIFYEAFKQTDVLPLGAGALAGVNYKIDRNFVAKILGFSKISSNSMDTVSDRDYQAIFLFACALCQVHLSRFAEDLIIFNTNEFSFIILDDAFTTGSSIMPNKKNPDILELIRGKSSHVIADLNGILVLLKGLPLTYNRDLQEDKPFIFHAADTVERSLDIFSNLIQSIKFNQKAIQDAMNNSFILATDIADYLVKKGVPFREAHRVCGALVLDCIKKNRTFKEISLKEFKEFHSKFDSDIMEVLRLSTSVKSKLSSGSTNPDELKKQILNVRKKISLKYNL